MDWDKVARSLVGALGLFFIFLAISAVLGVAQSHPAVSGDLMGAAVCAGIGAVLLRIRREPPEPKEPDQQPLKQPMVRREWWIAMAIAGVSLMAIVFTTCNGHGVVGAP